MGLSSRPITDFISDDNIKSILSRWLRVRSEAGDLKDLETALVGDVEMIFG